MEEKSQYQLCIPQKKEEIKEEEEKTRSKTDTVMQGRDTNNVMFS